MWNGFLNRKFVGSNNSFLHITSVGTTAFVIERFCQVTIAFSTLHIATAPNRKFVGSNHIF